MLKEIPLETFTICGIIGNSDEKGNNGIAENS